MEYIPKYKVGDKVWIREDLHPTQDNIVEDMCRQKGKEVTITDAFKERRDNNCYYLSPDKEGFSWGDTMIDHEKTIGIINYEIY